MAELKDVTMVVGWVLKMVGRTVATKAAMRESCSVACWDPKQVEKSVAMMVAD
jgi:hypothetical protein